MSVAESSLNTKEQLVALRTGAGWMPLQETRWIAVTGEDRVRWLNGMVTNSVTALAPGKGAYTFLLSAQGRIQGDATVWAEGDRLLLETDAAQSAHLLELLDRFIIMDDVELAETKAEGCGLLVAGPSAAAMLQTIGMDANISKLLKRGIVDWRSQAVTVVNGYGPLVPRFELWLTDAEAANEMAKALSEAGCVACDAGALELLRMLEGTPRYGVDIRDRDLPQETAQTRALHFNKGCYLGQEIVERIRSRGAVHRTFASFVVHGDTPVPGTVIEAEGRKAGELTSIASEEIGDERLALGFVRLEALERGLPMTYTGGRLEARGSASAS